jgi:UDP-N-acetylglucosamine--N-acetylmuramyl-(pentapeptide) pyrophosphoryl-undecaprenol N-acetylglucosamine transferase
MALVVLIAGGGTGGHVYPAIALADAIHKACPRAVVRLVGTERGLEARVVPAAGWPLELVSAQPVLGRGFADKLRALVALARGTVQAVRLLRRTGASLVIGVGGYASVPAVLAAALLRVPIGLLEVNARPGRANRLLGRFARGVFVQFDAAARYFPAGRCVRTGVPIRDIPEARPGDPSRVRLLVFGGSQGSRTLNRALTGALDQLAPRDGFRITHQTGPAHFDEVRAEYARAGVAADVAPFYDDLPERIAQADLVVSRAGAGTCAELCMAGVPSILVPLPLAEEHQAANARALEEAGAAVVVRDDEAAARLPGEIRRLARDPELRRRMAAAAARHGQRDAAARIWSLCSAWVPQAEEGRP